MTDWRVAHVGVEGDGLEIGGLEIWRNEWRQVYEPDLSLPHPHYQAQTHNYGIYEIGSNEHPVRFAAGELSNGVWGFYVPAK